MRHTWGRRAAVLAAAAAAAMLIAPGVAYAAPGDEAPEFPLTPVCTAVGQVGDLPRRECSLLDSVTGELIEDSTQRFVYPPEDSQQEPPTFTAPAPRPAPTRAVERVSEAADPSESGPVRAPAVPAADYAPRPATVEQPVTDTTANGDPMAVRDGLPETCVPDAVRGMPGFDPNQDLDGDGVSCESSPRQVGQAAPASDDEGLLDGPAPYVLGVLAVGALVFGLARRRPSA